MADDLRSRLTAHPLLDQLTNRQMDAIVAIVHGQPEADPHLPAQGEVWHGRGQHTVRVLSYVPKVVMYVVLTMPDGGSPGRHEGPWSATLRGFLGGFTFEAVDRG